MFHEPIGFLEKTGLTEDDLIFIKEMIHSKGGPALAFLCLEWLPVSISLGLQNVGVLVICARNAHRWFVPIQDNCALCTMCSPFI